METCLESNERCLLAREDRQHNLLFNYRCLDPAPSIPPVSLRASTRHLSPGGLRYFGIARPSIDDSRLNGARITGYPADRSNGEMWTSGACSCGWNVGGGSFLGVHMMVSLAPQTTCGKTARAGSLPFQLVQLLGGRC
jgi:hypothetical protein